ncbi:hypothetical protein [Nocardia sp. NBC_00416]|uniref:hypothetical protein n=1 Tax=Nocardia sp. NBC_00416 TaxID=2975991 RepID=UPI002E24E62C
MLSGIGSGLVNPPLASTAVGVVPVQRSGMASGINNTCRQVGIALGIAVYGSLFTARLHSALGDRLADHPGLAAHTDRLAGAAHDGRAQAVLATLPDSDRAVVAQAIHAAFAAALDSLLVVSGVVAVIGAVCATLLVRSRDFVPAPAESSATPSHSVPEPA